MEWRNAPRSALVKHDVEIEHFKLRVAQPVPKIGIYDYGDGGCDDGGGDADAKGGEEGEVVEREIDEEGGENVETELGSEERARNTE